MVTKAFLFANKKNIVLFLLVVLLVYNENNKEKETLRKSLFFLGSMGVFLQKRRFPCFLKFESNHSLILFGNKNKVKLKTGLRQIVKT